MSDFDTRVDAMIEHFVSEQKSYLEECERDRNRGHRPHYCFHGVNMWVDYDCACGACENGEINEYSSREEIREYAIEVVESQIAIEKRKEEEKEAMITLIMQGPEKIDRDAATEMYNKVFNR